MLSEKFNAPGPVNALLHNPSRIERVGTRTTLPVRTTFYGAQVLALAGLAACTSNPYGVAASTRVQSGKQTSSTITVDITAARHLISPDIYGVAYATPGQLKLLGGVPNRMGGNSTTNYNWKLNADNRGNDWFFESLADASAIPGERAATFISNCVAAGSTPLITIPTIGWVARLGPNRGKLSSFSVAKYGPQQKTDGYMPDAGNGLRNDGSEITGDDPHDAAEPVDATYQAPWIKMISDQLNAEAPRTPHEYVLDNEPSIWHSTHRDVEPRGATMEEVRDKMLTAARTIKAADPRAVILGPEEWGWSGYLWSGADQQYANKHGYTKFPDKEAHAGATYLPWLLWQMRQAGAAQRLLDVFTVHYYPQGGEGGNDVSPPIQAKRNRSTRSLWDPAYTDESWIKSKVELIPRLKRWVAESYPGTKVGITEYNWGAEGSMSGATAQADVLGIFGREGLDMANRWTTPPTESPTFSAMRLFTNYNGVGGRFGNVSVQCAAPDPDTVSAFAADRPADSTLTVVVVAKSATGSDRVRLLFSHLKPAGKVGAWRVGPGSDLANVDSLSLTGGVLAVTVPAPSVTLYEVKYTR